MLSSKNTDPLRLRGTKKEQKQEVLRRAKYQRGQALEWLYNNKHITKLQYLAGCKIRALYAECEGQASSIDFTQPRVDCSRKVRDWLLVSTTDANRTLERIAALLGPDQSQAVFAIAGQGLSITEAAIGFEENEAKREAGTPSRATRDYVSRLARNGLGHVAGEVDT
ncbi:hypothetical protein PsAD5_02620 [Pseudovibrio sp. Ad5]|uniref:hypothetical protein n=1 Tax=Pseudovibrio sp. Ad5 TaxID=989436 RepID=UPI0007AECA65|nr:hypothetical protein [Pseudovibrio sp. Ad5]KZK96427.1 hypothetical protein PsAD5_02620 [Pseudovibrio sp. Ad5]